MIQTIENSEHRNDTAPFDHPLLGIKHQAPNLDRLPLRCVLGTRRVQECGVWGQPGLAIVCVEALDQDDLFWCLVTKVVPAVLRVVLDAERRALAVTVDVPSGDEVNIRFDRTPISDSERVMSDGVLDRPPDIDDTDTGLEETLGLIRKMVMHTLLSGDVCLIDMYTSLRRTMSLNAK